MTFTRVAKTVANRRSVRKAPLPSRLFSALFPCFYSFPFLSLVPFFFFPFIYFSPFCSFSFFPLFPFFFFFFFCTFLHFSCFPPDPLDPLPHTAMERWFVNIKSHALCCHIFQYFPGTGLDLGVSMDTNVEISFASALHDVTSVKNRISFSVINPPF